MFELRDALQFLPSEFNGSVYLLLIFKNVFHGIYQRKLFLLLQDQAGCLINFKQTESVEQAHFCLVGNFISKLFTGSYDRVSNPNCKIME
jgi:hypothetical protein